MALVFGTEPEPSYFVRSTTVQAPARSKTPHPAQTERAVLSPLLRPRRRRSLNMDPLRLINTLSKVTPEAVEQIRESHRENVILPNLLVDLEEFRAWDETDQLPIEYSSATNQITVLASPGPIHQYLEIAMNNWLEEVATSLTNEEERFSSRTQYRVELDDGQKIPDAVLFSHNIARKYPIIAVEVGWTEPVEKLFEDAERLIYGTRQGIDIVILLKVFEKERHARDEFPWGIHPYDITSLRAMNDANQLAPTILAWYKNNNLALLGQLDVHLYWYPRTRTTRPTIPRYRFHYSISEPSEPNGMFTGTLNTAGSTSLSNNWQAEIGGRSFELPVKALEQALQNGANAEQNERVYSMIKKAGI